MKDYFIGFFTGMFTLTALVKVTDPWNATAAAVGISFVGSAVQWFFDSPRRAP